MELKEAIIHKNVKLISNDGYQRVWERGEGLNRYPHKGVNYFVHTGTCFRWWLVQGDTTGRNFKVLGGDPWGLPIPHHLQYGGGSSGASLDLFGGRRRGREGRVGKGGDTPRHHFLRGLWPGCINGTGLVAGIV